MNTYPKNKSVRHPRAGRFLVTLAAAALLLSSCQRQEPLRLAGEAQGTYYSIQYFDAEQRNLQPQIDSLLLAFDRSASLWVDSSLLRRINAGQTDTLDDILRFLLQNSLRIMEYTDGAFDPRVGRLVQSWGFSFKARTEPDSATLAALLRAANGAIGCEDMRFFRENPDTELDFNAIAQGYASDLVARLLESHGIGSYLVDIGGEVISRGLKPDGKPWRVGIERPAENRYSEPVVQTAIALTDASVVTSGSYRKYYEKDGVRYSHTIDPATGRPVQHSLLSVSVVEEQCWLADAMCTAYMVMGLDSARRFIARHPDGPGTGAVYFIYDSCGTLKEYGTKEFMDLVVKQ
ncbi:MAG: FAD:protein FMN transferase [Bacteroidales bacterium]|nr:FAD:protein FMN transferase [Bacteroidales bacterium]